MPILRRLFGGGGSKGFKDPGGVRAQEEQTYKEMLTSGFTGAEWAEALRGISGVEQAGRARIAGVMGRGGGAFDPTAFARATAPLAGMTGRAVGGLHAREAQMRRAGMSEWMAYRMKQQQLAQERAQQRRAARASFLGGAAQFGMQLGTLGMLGRGGGAGGAGGAAMSPAGGLSTGGGIGGGWGPGWESTHRPIGAADLYPLSSF